MSAISIPRKKVASGLLSGAHVPAEIDVIVKEARIVLAELKKHGICVIQCLTLRNRHIFSCLARPDAIRDGVRKVFIIDGRVPHALLIECLTDEGAGTMFKQELDPHYSVG